MRLFSASSTATRVSLSLEGGVSGASALNLLKEVQAPLDVSSGSVRMDVSGFGLRTVELVPAQARPLPVPR
ncbi:hypothetical protein BH24ACI5_BH24ACI5_24860 [soil metagenome]